MTLIKRSDSLRRLSTKLTRVEKAAIRYGFLPYEKRMLTTGMISPVNLRFRRSECDADLEQSFWWGQWDTVYYAARLSGVALVVSLGLLSGMDVTSGMLWPVLRIRLIARAVLVALALVTLVLIRLTGNVKLKRQLLTVFVGLFFTKIIVTGEERLYKALGLSKPCAAADECACYSLIAFISVLLAWSLVTLRLPFIHAVGLYATVSVVYVSSGLALQIREYSTVASTGFEVISILLITITFSTSARRSEVLNRTRFLREAAAQDFRNSRIRRSKELRTSGVARVAVPKPIERVVDDTKADNESTKLAV